MLSLATETLALRFLLPAGTRSLFLSQFCPLFPLLFLSSTYFNFLSSPLRSPLCFWRVGTFRFSASETFVRRSSPCVNRIQYSPPASGPPSDCVFFSSMQKNTASSTKEDVPTSKCTWGFLIAISDIIYFLFFEAFFKSRRNVSKTKL